MKVFIYIGSILWYIKTKIKFGSRIQCKVLNGIAGKFRIFLSKGSSIIFAGKFYCDGPVYISVSKDSMINIGKSVYFNRNVSITALKKITIGDNCMFANNVVIVDHDHLFRDGKLVNEFATSSIEIGNNVWVGANCTITSGVSIGDNTVIGANSVVTKSIPSGVLAVGTPAKVIKEL